LLGQTNTFVLTIKLEINHILSLHQFQTGSHSFSLAVKFVDSQARLTLVTSCEGLLFVCDLDNALGNEYDIIHIISPITDEYISLAPCQEGRTRYDEIIAFDFSSKTNQFKALRTSIPTCIPDDHEPSSEVLSEDDWVVVYTPGTGKWRNISSFTHAYDLW